VLRYPFELEPIPDDEDFEAHVGGTRMTLCIAAGCIEKKKSRIVTCIDWKATTALGSTQTFDKFQRLNKGWIALMAGKASRSKELTSAISKVLSSQEITASNLRDLVTIGAATHGRNLKEEYCLMKLGMNYDKFLEWTKDNQTLAEPYMDQIASLKLGASVLVAGFVKDDDGDDVPAICKVSQQSGEITIENHFGAIGEGASIAVPPLYRREYDWEETQLSKAIYYLYEAKTLAEILDSVGPATSIDVLYPDGELKSLTNTGYKYYDELLKQFGPKPKVTGVEWKDDYLGEFEDKPTIKQPTPQPSSSQKSERVQ
jgi:hypothetical protein